MGIEKFLSWLSKKLSDIISPVVFGFIGGASYAIIIKNPKLLVWLLVTVIFVVIIEYYLKKKYTTKCPYCGKYLKK